MTFAVSVDAQEAAGPSPTPSPTVLELQVPAIAHDFQPAQKPLPELGRVGVDMERQRPLSLREALALALENNKDIEVGRHNVKDCELDSREREEIRSEAHSKFITSVSKVQTQAS